jgi:hypothetical protein
MKKLTVVFFAGCLLALCASAAWAPCFISGFVYCDVNQSETVDEGDTPVVNVDILANGAYTIATTDANGYYEALAHEVCGATISLDETTLPDDVIFIDPSMNGVVYSWGMDIDWLIDSETCRVGDGEGCARSPGYWKNHPEAWPVEEITICDDPDYPLYTYTKDEAIASMSGDGDKTKTMFRALVAAKLNVLADSDDSCIEATIAMADQWMCENGPVGSGVKAGGPHSPWRDGEALYKELDNYNNGRLCVPKCQ